MISWPPTIWNTELIGISRTSHQRISEGVGRIRSRCAQHTDHRTTGCKSSIELSDMVTAVGPSLTLGDIKSGKPARTLVPKNLSCGCECCTYLRLEVESLGRSQFVTYDLKCSVIRIACPGQHE